MPSLLREAKITDLTLRDGRRLRVRRWSGSGTPRLLIHGLLDSSEGWRSMAEACPRPQIAVDLPGFGGSDLPTRPCVYAYAEDVLEALTRLDVREAAVVGHSLGGAVAAALCDLAPQRVASLALLAPAGFGRIVLAEAVSVPGVRNVAEALLPMALRSRLMQDASYRVFVSAGNALPGDFSERLRRDTTALTAGAVMATRAVVAAGRAGDGLHRRRLAYHGPVSVLWGSRDRVVPPAHARAVSRALPQAELSSWDGMGHHPQHERPAQLVNFLHAACAAPVAAARARARSPRAPQPARRELAVAV